MVTQCVGDAGGAGACSRRYEVGGGGLGNHEAGKA